ncbi:unnamed protein product [Paramecium sonneborni]|uniref:NACHT domain-containing protein n=1 Tax=Paramecium sonneborni TaxID=65129 RepID=A0A8S1KJ67_9CILI|nr:unnamed protein product [Paramecium sonneborni]
MLRGGGACANSRQQQSLQMSTLLISNQFETILTNNIQCISKNAEDTQNNYSELLSSLQALLSLDYELNNLIKSQNQLNKQIPNLEKSLQAILESCLLLKNNQLRYYAVKFAEKLSRTIFWHYCSAKSIKDGLQQSFITLFNKIELLNNNEDGFYKSLTEYEITLSKMIFTILPNDFQEGLEVIALFASINEVLMNALPKTMRETIKGGIVQSIRDATKVQYRKIYKQIFNIDIMKWWVLTELKQSTHTIKEIINELQEFYKVLSKSDYYVQQAWIIAISEIVSYAPTLSEDQLVMEQSEIQTLVDVSCLTKIKEEYRVNINIPKLKYTQCQGLYEKLPTLTLLQQIQEQIISRDKFFNILYDNKEEIKEQQKQETTAKTIFEYIFSLFVDCDIEINIDLIRKVNQQFIELNENIQLIKQMSLNKWIKMLESKQCTDPVVFGEFEQKQKQIKHLINKVKEIQKFFIQLDFIFTQWNFIEQITESDSKLQTQSAFVQENKQNLQDCETIRDLNQQNFKDLLLLSIRFDVYFLILTEFIERQYTAVYQVVQSTQSADPILSLYKQYKDVQDIVQISFRKVNEKILQFKEIFQGISEKLKQIEYNYILKFYHVSLKLQHQDLPNQIFEFRNSDHQTLYFIQNYEKQILKIQLINLHQAFKDCVSSSQFQDYEEAKIYLQTIYQICKSMESLLRQNKKLFQHINNFKQSIQIVSSHDKFNDLLNIWTLILQTTTELDQQQFDQAVFLVKYDQLYMKYEQILKLNQQIRWPFNQYLGQYFKMLNQLETIFQELKTFKTFDATADPNTQNRYDSLRLNLKQISQSQIQRIKSTLEQYTLGVDQLQNKLENQTHLSIEDLLNQLINMQEALDDTLNQIQMRINQPQSQQNVGSLNLIQSNRLSDFDNLYNYKIHEDIIVIASYIKFNYNFIEQNAIMDSLKLDLNDDQNQHVVQSGINSAQIRILMFINLINIWNSCLGQEEYDIISKLILQLRLNESNQIIKKEIKTTYKKEFLFILDNILKNLLPNLEEDLRSKIQERNQLSFQIKYEPSFEKSQNLNEKLNSHTNQISTIFQNLQELESDFNYQIPFYHQLMNEFKKADQSTSTLDVSEIKFYQGKQLTELFLLRMDQVSRMIKIQQVKNTYVELECQKKNEIKILVSRKQNKNGIIDKFLEDQQQNQLLVLQGEAGSGKSLAIKMIEEFVWKRNDAIKIIPVIVKLSELKDPIYNAINETLRSLNYKFDVSQIEQLQKDVNQNKMQMLFIFEEYDKLSQHQIEINLFKSNNLYQWKTPSLQKSPKYIIATRSELFKYSNHLRWIDNQEIDYNFQNYWNVKILPFSIEQKNKFLLKFQELIVRNTVIDYYQILCEFEHQDLLMQNFIQLWKKIDLNLNESSIENSLITQSTINKIVNALKQEPKLKNPNDIAFQNLQKSLEQIKSFQYYQKMLEQLNYQQSIDNPSILNVYVSALPKYLQNKSHPEIVKKEYFDIYFNDNYAINCDIQTCNSQIEKDWNKLINSQFFQLYNAEDPIAKTQIYLAQQFGDDQQFQNKVINIIEKMNITHYDLYEQFLTNFFDTALIRIQINDQSINLQAFQQEQWNFCLNLAQKLSQHEIFTIHFNSQGSLIKVGGSVTEWEQYFNDDEYVSQNNKFSKKLLRNSIPLREQFSIYSFENKIIQEFLVAKAIITQLEALEKNSQLDEVMQNSILMLKNISSPFFLGTVNFFVQKCKRKFSLKQQLIKIIQQSSFGEQYCTLASNAFYLLQNIDGVFKGLYFQGIRLKDIPLDQCHFYNCNLQSSEWTNISVNSLTLMKNNMKNMKCQNLKLSTFSFKNSASNPKFIKQFKSGKLIIVNENRIQNIKGETIIDGKFNNCSIIEIKNRFYVKTSQQVCLLKEQNDLIEAEILKIPNVHSISEFDQYIMIFQINSDIDGVIFELNSKTNQIKHQIPINQSFITDYNIKKYYQMYGNKILFLTNTQQISSMHYQIENDQLQFDNLTNHASINGDDQIVTINYYNDLDITVVSFRDQDSMQIYDIIYGTINQLIGRFILLENQKIEFFFLKNDKLQLINQETFKMINECSISNVKLDLLQNNCIKTNDSVLFSFIDSIVILSLHPFEVIKFIQVGAIDFLLNKQINQLQILTQKEIINYDVKYLEDRQNQIKQFNYQFEEVVFSQTSPNFLGRIRNTDEIVLATFKKNDFEFKVLMKSKNPRFYLSNEQNSAIICDGNCTVYFDLKNNMQTKIVNLQYEKILWIKDNQNLFYIQSGFVEEYRNSVITIKNKIQSKQSYRQIKQVQSTENKLYIATTTNDTIVINQQFVQEYITTKQMNKKYREYYITENDLRYESSNRNTITIHYKTNNRINDFWIFSDTILIKEQQEDNDMALLVLLEKQNCQTIAEIYVKIDFIAYTKEQILIITNKLIWLTYSALNLQLLQTTILNANTMFVSSNYLDQLMIISQYSEITIWNTITNMVEFNQKNVELIQYVKMIPCNQNEYYIADRDILKLYIQHQVRFSIQLSKKRINLITNKYGIHHHIYQVEEDKVIYNCMSEDNKVINWRKVVFELDSIREQIVCYDNRDSRLVFLGGSKVQQVQLDAFDDIKVLDIPSTFKGCQVKYNRDCSTIYLRSNEQLLVVESMTMNIINQINLREILPQPYDFGQKLEIYCQNYNNIIIQQEKNGYHFVYNYNQQTGNGQLDMITIGNYNHFIGTNSYGLLIINSQSGIIELFQPKIINPQNNFVSYNRQQQHNKSNIVKCDICDNLLENSQIISTNGQNLSDLWKQGEQVDLLISF